MHGLTVSIFSSRRSLFTILYWVAAVVAAYEIAEFILGGDLNSIIYIGMMVGGVLGVVTILNDWRKGFYLFLAWILFEDFVRKFLGNNMAIYFAKDAIALLLYLSFFRARRRDPAERFRPAFFVPLFCFFFFGLLQIFNPSSNSIFYGLMGMKLYFLYVPLLYVSYYFIDSERRLRSFLAFNSGLI